ncbi:hypothetical protein [Corallococcus macrosporus]|uniref:Lipoprotein n=1 Tax=Corallococcus macrosporus DSM 14697 TaxID=1189310 RepID=A0A250JWD9_9BACT|nr:hypothetical protein [Corallococcus macrosporus]ATB47436.1 hypothetical protein MYMAC_003050 [Corallococcus macrosporus DSM 14697]
MKRSTLALLLASAGLSGSCSATDATTGFAGLSGTFDVTLANDLVFVTSSDRDELRVLDLASNPRTFIPAPNPLEALSIPVLDRPDALTRDVAYNAEGNDVPGPYIYARSSGSPEISVVAAARDQLRQVARLQAASIVTAFAARSPAEGSGGPSGLYYAIQDPDGLFTADTGGARVMRQDLPGPEALAAAEPGSLPAPVTVFCLQPGESILAMTMLAGPDTFALATRQASGRSGRTLLVTDAGPVADCLQPSTPTVDLSAGFGNVPVRILASHPRVDIPDAGSINAGRYIFGVRDESACSAARECSGVLAVDTESSPPGQTARDLSGAPMLPIFPAGGLPTGLALVPDPNLRFVLDNGAETRPRVPLLGVMPSSNGYITLFSASDLRQFDLSAATARSTVALLDSNELPVTIETTDLVTVTQDPTLQRTVLYEGSVSNGFYRIIYQGGLPGLSSLPRDPATPRLFEAEAAVASTARAGDILVLESPEALCAIDLPIASVEPVAGTSRVRFVIADSQEIPADCASLTRFTVRAGGDQPFVLFNEAGTFLSRDVTGASSYSVPTEYFFHPDGFYFDDDSNPQTPPVPNLSLFPQPPPPLHIRVAAVGRELRRGDRYAVTVISGIRNYVFTPDVAAGTGLAFYTLPGPVVAAQNREANMAYIAYPSADGILQVGFEGLTDNRAQSLALVPFE